MNVTGAAALMKMLLSCYTLFPDGRHPTSVDMTAFQYSSSEGLTVQEWKDGNEGEKKKIKFERTDFDRIQLQMVEEDGNVVLGGQISRGEGWELTNCPVVGDMKELHLITSYMQCDRDCFYRMKDVIYRINNEAGNECILYTLDGIVSSRQHQPEVDCSSPLGFNPEENLFVFKKDGESKEVDYSNLNTTWTPNACGKHGIKLEPNVYSKFYHLRYLLAVSGCGENLTDTDEFDNTYVKFIYKPTGFAALVESNFLYPAIAVAGGLLVLLIVSIVLAIVFRKKLKVCVAKRHKKNIAKTITKTSTKKDLKKTEDGKSKDEPGQKEKASVGNKKGVSKENLDKGTKKLKEKSEETKKTEEKKEKEKTEDEDKEEGKKKEKEEEKKKKKAKQKKKTKTMESEESTEEKEAEKAANKKHHADLVKIATKLSYWGMPTVDMLPEETVFNEDTQLELPQTLPGCQTYSYSGYMTTAKVGKLFKYKEVSRPEVEVVVKVVEMLTMGEMMEEFGFIGQVQLKYGQLDELYLLEVLGNGQFSHQVFIIMPMYYRTMNFFIPGHAVFNNSSRDDRFAVGWAYLKCIRQLHSLGFAHNDIRPDSFKQKTKDSNTIVLCDFHLLRPFGTERLRANEKTAYLYYPLTAYEMKVISNVDDYQSWLFMFTILLSKKYEWMVQKGTHKQRLDDQYQKKKEFYSKLRGGPDVPAEEKLLYDLKKPSLMDMDLKNQ